MVSGVVSEAARRQLADKVRADVVRQRVFRLLVLPTINEIEHEEERRAKSI